MKQKYKYDRLQAINPIHNEANEGTIPVDVAVNSIEFLNNSFDIFERRREVDRVGFVFAIPTRVRRDSEQYWDEAYGVIPALKHLPLDTAYKCLSSMPPTVIESYKDRHDQKVGCIMFVPIFEQMKEDFIYPPNLKRTLLSRINDASDLASEVYGANYIGLGGIIPRLTSFGKDIKSNIIVTTGHAGTVWLMLQTIDETLVKYDDDVVIGFIGGGAIGRSAILGFVKKNKNSSIMIYDKRDRINNELYSEVSRYTDRAKIADSNEHLIEESDVIVSAITSPIDLDMDFSGKTIIDDSQPPSFQRDQIEKNGGKLVWVVGRSKKDFYHREHGYNFGDRGLASTGDLWGCEAEVASLFAIKAQRGITSEINESQIQYIEEIFRKTTIVKAPDQSFGKLISSKSG